MTYLCIPVQQPFTATVTVPGSKSVANRALMCAAMSMGRSDLENVPDGDDAQAMLAALDALGIGIQRSGSDVVIERTGVLRASEVHAGLAGTTSRFLAALVATSGYATSLDGHDRLRERPFGPLFDALRTLGADIRDTDGGLPARIQGPLRGGSLEIDATMSSQFISALMMVAPLLPQGLNIVLRGELVSRPYVNLTASVMEIFGATVSIADTAIEIAEQPYQSTTIHVEPDASSASYPLAIAAVTGSTVTVEGFGSSSRQGDAKIVEILHAMGARVIATPTSTTLSASTSEELRGIDLDMSEVSDLVPTVAAVGCLATSPTRIRGVGFIRAKESDRIGDLATELRKFGAEIQEYEDGLSIMPRPLHGAVVDSHEDHRLAMAFSIIGAKVPGVEINDPGVVSKSWPTYWDELKQMTSAV